MWNRSVTVRNKVHRITVSTALDLAPQLTTALGALRDLRMADGSTARRIQVLTWNGTPVIDGDGAQFLARAGFRREYPGMTYDALQARSASRA